MSFDQVYPAMTLTPFEKRLVKDACRASYSELPIAVPSAATVCHAGNGSNNWPYWICGCARGPDGIIPKNGLFTRVRSWLPRLDWPGGSMFMPAEPPRPDHAR